MFAIPSLGLHFYICSEWSYPCPWWQVSPLSVAAIVALILSISSSWYPKKTDVENGPDSGLTPPQSIMGYPSSSSLFGTGVAPHRSRLEDRHTSHQLELPRRWSWTSLNHVAPPTLWLLIRPVLSPLLDEPSPLWCSRKANDTPVSS